MPYPRSAGPTYDSLSRALRARGLPRLRHDTVAAMQERLRAAEAADGAVVQLMPAIVAADAVIDALVPALSRHGGRRVSGRVVLLPAGRIRTLRHIARRRGWPVGDPAGLGVSAAEPAPALWAAARFVRALGEMLRWRSDLLPHDLDLVPAPTDPSAARQAEALLRAWTAQLDAWRDPDAELSPEPLRPRRRRPVPGIGGLIDQARAERRRVAITYQGAARAVVTHRVIEPLGTESHHGLRYVRAWCCWRRAERLFRLDRVLTADLLDERFDGAGDVTAASANGMSCLPGSPQ